jgi:predicted ATP-dependent protease
VNQYGQVQAIGGVNEKIEGFFDLCKARGLTGKQGVLIPASNVDNLMLRSDVVEAARNGLFSIYPVTHVDEGIEILTGIPAGDFDEHGSYPPGTINGRAVAKLKEMAEKLKKFSAPPDDEDE